LDITEAAPTVSLLVRNNYGIAWPSGTIVCAECRTIDRRNRRTAKPRAMSPPPLAWRPAIGRQPVWGGGPAGDCRRPL